MKRTRKRMAKKRDTKRYFVMIRRTRTGYSIDVPDVPGCIAVAKTVPGARRMIAEALTLHFELMSESGETIPLPSQSIRFDVDESSDEEFGTWVNVVMPALMSAHP